MSPFVTRLSEDASEVGSANDERWATDSDYGLSERQLQEAAANKRSAVGAVDNSKQTGTSPKSDSFWAALLAGLPFLSEFTSCTSPCFVADCKYRNDLSRIPSQDNAHCVSCAEEVINPSSPTAVHGSSSPSMLGRPPSTHFATLIVERDNDVQGLHPNGEPSTFYIGEDVEMRISDPAMLEDSNSRLATSHDTEHLEVHPKSEDTLHASTVTSIRHKAMSHEPDKLEAKSQDAAVCDSATQLLKHGDSKANLSMSCERLQSISECKDAACDSVVRSCSHEDSKALQDTAVHMDTCYYREPDVEEPEPESEDWVE